jgi:predicted RNase H-like HicB family nuclease
MKLRYDITIFWSDADDAYIGSVRDLPGCTGDGGTYHEALSALEKAMKLWIETARHAGRDVPKPRRHRHA